MIVVLGLIALLLVIIVVRTIRFKPRDQKVTPAERVTINEEEALHHFIEILKCQTVTYNDEAKINEEAFDQMKQLIRELYPKVHECLEVEYIEKRGILFYWKGKQSDQVTVLMAHYDVVPVHESDWTVPPFGGKVDDTYIWGRGTLDTKVTFTGILEAVEYALGQSFVPRQDVYLAFGGDEEVSGPSAPAIVETLKERGIKPYLVLDEGGAIVQNIFPGVEEACAFVGIGEKGYIDCDVVIKGHGGHSSSPPPQTLTQKLARAIVKLEKHPFKSELSLPARALFDSAGRHSKWAYRMIFANLWIFSPVIKYLFKKIGGEMNALVRSTLSVTQLEGSNAYNVLPGQAKMGVNMRLLQKDTAEEALNHMKAVIGPEFEVNVIETREASPYTDLDSDQWRLVKDAILEIYPQVVVSPYLMLGGSDSRHYTEIADHILRFSPMNLNSEELGRIHSKDERISKKNYYDALQFFINLVGKL